MEFVQHFPNLAKLVAVSSVAGTSELVCLTPPLHIIAHTAAIHTTVLVWPQPCGPDKVHVVAVQWYVYYIYAAVIGML